MRIAHSNPWVGQIVKFSNKNEKHYYMIVKEKNNAKYVLLENGKKRTINTPTKGNILHHEMLNNVSLNNKS